MKSMPKNTSDSVEEAVKHCYSTWGDNYYDDYYGPKAPYPPVHLPLIQRLVNAASPRRLLDAGCGPASILRHLTDPEREIYGFDLTPEMVQEARKVMRPKGIPDSRIWLGSIANLKDFYCPSENSVAAYDLILSVGVFPHLQSQDEGKVISNLYDCLNPDGVVIVEARNELFSLFTLNRYSKDFFLSRLLRKSDLLSKVGSEAVEFQAAMEQLGGMFRTDLPPLRLGKKGEPGYDEVVSRLHNPLVLAKQFSDAGFSNIKTLFYHFHALPPMFSSVAPNFFREQSLSMEGDPEDWRGYFMASAFILMATRP